MGRPPRTRLRRNIVEVMPGATWVFRRGEGPRPGVTHSVPKPQDAAFLAVDATLGEALDRYAKSGEGLIGRSAQTFPVRACGFPLCGSGTQRASLESTNEEKGQSR